MLKNYIKIAWRNIRNAPIYSGINILGLGIGMACCLLIYSYVNYQLSFDRQHTQKEKIFRLNKEVTPETGGTEFHAITSGPMGPQLKEDFPEVKGYTRVLPWFSEVLLRREDDYYKTDRFLLADSTFFSTFDFKLLAGSKSTALTEPLSVVISEKVAQLFFGDGDPIGQTITGLNDLDYTVTGVIENAPENSHLQYEVLASWSSVGPGALDFGWLQNWRPQAIYTYLLLDSSQSAKQLQPKLSGFMERHFSERADQYKLYLQPLDEIYLHSSAIRYDDTVRSGSIVNVYIFSAVAILILFIACINFVNISVARCMNRIREVGIRKSLGAQRDQVSVYFLTESLMLSLLGSLLAVGLVEMLIPVLQSFGIIAMFDSFFKSTEVLAAVIGIGILCGLISGLYPALVLSRFHPVSALKGGNNEELLGGSQMVRKGLVVFQFALSIILIIGSLVIYRQMDFVRSKNLGFQKEQVLVLPIGSTDIYGKASAFKSELLRFPGIQQVAASNSVPGSSFMSYSINPEGKQTDESWTTNVLLLGDYDFQDAYGLKMKTGRFFSEDFASDSTNAVVINETLARSLGWEEPVGKRIDIPGDMENGRVIGVVEDFHTASLHRSVEPLLLFLDHRYGFLSVRFDPEQTDQVLDQIAETWQQFDAGYPFEYFFLDRRFEAFYRQENQTLEVVALFTGLSIFVALLGLFGLSSFLIRRRTKEIGIRKVLGASVTGLLGLISFDFLKLIVIGYLLAIPIGYVLVNKWLETFAYHTEVGPMVFLISGVIALLLGVIAVFYQSLRAAYQNPTESLRSE